MAAEKRTKKKERLYMKEKNRPKKKEKIVAEHEIKKRRNIFYSA